MALRQCRSQTATLALKHHLSELKIMKIGRGLRTGDSLVKHIEGEIWNSKAHVDVW